jgi:hypothetical protein
MNRRKIQNPPLFSGGFCNQLEERKNENENEEVIY